MSTVDVEALRSSLNIVDVVGRYVPLTKDGAEFRGVCPFHDDHDPSLTVHPGKQLWACFACGQHEQYGADVFGFVRSYENCTFPEVIERLRNGAGGNGSAPPERKALKKPSPRKTFPHPTGEIPDMTHRDYGAPAQKWMICTADGTPYFYEARYLVEGEKQTRFWTWGQSGEDPPRWECRHPSNPRPFYGVEYLEKHPRAQVMIHEAPKKAEAGRALFPAQIHLGIVGGANQAGHMDVSVLAGRSCILLPDNDEAGTQAMTQLAGRLWAAGAKSVKGINPDTQPDGNPSPEGWDIADTVDWTADVAVRWAKTRKFDYQQPSKTAQEPPQRAQGDPAHASHETPDKPPIAKPHPRRSNGSAGPTQVAETKEEAKKAILGGMNYRRVSEVAIKPLRWLWPGRIPLGKVSLIVGDPGLGKSQICASLTSVLTNGGQWPVSRERCEPGSVLLLSAEDDVEDTIRPRLEAAGADVEKVTVLRSVLDHTDEGAPIERGFSLGTDLARMSVLVDELKDCRLVVIDPVSAYLGQTDSHKNAEVRGLLAPLSQFASDRRLAVILVSHLTKSQSTNALQRVQGSIAFAAMARAVWGVAKDQEDGARRLFVPLKNNLAQDTSGLAYSIESVQLEGREGDEDQILTSRVMWEAQEVSASADEVFGSYLSHEERGTVEEAKEFLRETLADGPARSTDIQRSSAAAGHSRTALFKAKKLLRVTARREGGLGKLGIWYWSLPDERIIRE